MIWNLERESRESVRIEFLFRDVLPVEKNMVVFGTMRGIQRNSRKWIWWPELAGNDKKLPLVNSVVCVCVCDVLP